MAKFIGITPAQLHYKRKKGEFIYGRHFWRFVDTPACPWSWNAIEVMGFLGKSFRLAADATPKPYSPPTPYRIGHGG